MVKPEYQAGRPATAAIRYPGKSPSYLVAPVVPVVMGVTVVPVTGATT